MKIVYHRKNKISIINLNDKPWYKSKNIIFYKETAIIEKAIMQQEAINETLKASNQLECGRRMNSIRNRAEEIVFTELVYA